MVWREDKHNGPEIKNRHGKEKDTICSLCKQEDETLVHFILVCDKLETRRDRVLLRKYEQTTREATVEKIFFEPEDTEELKKMLEALWRLRTRLLKREQEAKKTRVLTEDQKQQK